MPVFVFPGLSINKIFDNGLKTPLRSPKVTAWCAVSRFGVIGPVLFSRKITGPSLSLSLVMLETYLRHKLEETGDEHDLVRFQQDGTTAQHFARISLVVLRRMFPGKLVSLRGKHRLVSALP